MRSSIVSDFAMDVVRPAVLKIGGVFFDKGDRNLNLIAGRTPNVQAGLFDDWAFLIQKIDGKWDIESLRITTDPGDPEHAKNKAGAARIAPQQARGAWEISYHHYGDPERRYPALRQRKPILIERHKDNLLDEPVSTASELIYANWHAAGLSPFVNPFDNRWSPGRRVGNWSEGCIVMADALEYATLFWPTILLSAAAYGPKFTGTLVNIPDPPWAKK